MKTVFHKEEIVRGLTGIILLSHGPFAPALVESAELIAGAQENLVAFGLEASDRLEDYAGAIAEAYEAFEERAVVLVDLFGGTPGNQLVLYALKNGKKVPAVSGLNLPMLLEACALREETEADALAALLAQAGQAGIIDMSERIAQRRG